MTKEEFKMNLLLLGFAYLVDVDLYHHDKISVAIRAPFIPIAVDIYTSGICTRYYTHEEALDYLINN